MDIDTACLLVYQILSIYIQMMTAEANIIMLLSNVWNCSSVNSITELKASCLHLWGAVKTWKR